MNYNEIKDLITRIDQSSLTEFELKLDNAYVKMGKNSAATLQPASNAKAAPEVQLEPITILPEEIPVKPEGRFVVSPIVGTFYGNPSPDKPSFVKLGDRVKKGDVLCIVEAMKVMNEITSEFDGQIAEICADNEQMVEYGQNLFRIV